MNKEYHKTKCPENCWDCWDYNEFDKICTLTGEYLDKYTGISSNCPYKNYVQK